MKLPSLPPKAAYVHLRNPSRRNALSLEVLQDLRAQIVAHLTSPSSGRLLTLPSFNPDILPAIEGAQLAPHSSATIIGRSHSEYTWLVDAETWRKEREGLPNVLVLRSEGPVFSSGHDLKQLASLSHDDVKKTFALCAELMALIRHSPAPVVCPIQGLATAAGLQLALSTDYPIAMDSTEFQLPGASIGLPCTSPSTAVSRRASPALTYRMLLTAEAVRAKDMGGAVDVVETPEHAESTDTAAAAFESRVAHIVNRLAGSGGQSMALGKWAYWTQLGIKSGGADGYEDAAAWAGRVMALHARCEDAREGMSAFAEKRKPSWGT